MFSIDNFGLKESFIIQNAARFLECSTTPFVLNIKVKNFSQFDSNHVFGSFSSRFIEAIIQFDGMLSEEYKRFLLAFKSLKVFKEIFQQNFKKRRFILPTKKTLSLTAIYQDDLDRTA